MPKSIQSIPKAKERSGSPTTMSPVSESTIEGSLMPPPRLTRRRSPRRLQSPDQTSSNTIGLSSSKSRKELPAPEPKRPGDGLSKTRQSAHARSPVAETVSKPSTSAASNKRRSGVVKEVEKMQVTVIQLYARVALLPSLAPINDQVRPFHLNISRNAKVLLIQSHSQGCQRQTKSCGSGAARGEDQGPHEPQLGVPTDDR